MIGLGDGRDAPRRTVAAAQLDARADRCVDSHAPQSAGVLRRILAVVGSHAQHVALVGHDIVELVLPEEALGRGIALPLLLARLDGDGEMVVAEWDVADTLVFPGPVGGGS